MLIMCCICSIHAFENKIQHQAQSHGTDDEHCDLQQCDTAKTSQIIAAALVRSTAFNLTLNGKKTHLDFFIGIQSIRYRCIAERNYEHRKTKRGPCKNALVQLSKNITFI